MSGCPLLPTCSALCIGRTHSSCTPAIRHAIVGQDAAQNGQPPGWAEWPLSSVEPPLAPYFYHKRRDVLDL